MLIQKLTYYWLLRQSLVLGLVLSLYLLWVDDESQRIVLGLRLGVSIVVEHTCVCGANVDVFGIHGLSCRCSGGRIPWHAAVNENALCAVVSGGVPAALEPVGVCHDDGKRPDGMSLILWRQGFWDFTCSDTLALCQLPPEVPASWQTLQNQPISRNTLL